jgi:hypothetical protein
MATVIERSLRETLNDEPGGAVATMPDSALKARVAA